MKEIKKLGLCLGCAVLFIAFYFLCAGSAQSAREYYAGYDGSSTIKNVQNISIEDAVHQYVTAHLEKEIKITGTGDIMFYEYQMTRAYNSESQTFDFSPSFQYISKYLTDSSYVLGNFEATMAGKEKGKSSNTMGYWADVENMNFNVPEQAAKDLKVAGFDMLTTANNHAMDSGIEGLSATIDFIKDAGLDQTGSFKADTDPKYEIKNIDGINVGFIAYSSMINETLDAEHSYALNSLDEGESGYSDTKVTLLCSQINEMRTKGAEFVVLYLHFGTKYAAEPGEAQKQLARQLVNAGADVIFGSYPHVVQPMELITATASDGSERTGVVFYSLGNFISSMQYQSSNGYSRDLGAIASVVLTKDNTGAHISGIEIVPTYVDWTDKDIVVLPVCEVKDNASAFASRFENDDTAYLDKQRIETGFDGVIKSIIGDSGLNYTYSDYKYKISLEK